MTWKVGEQRLIGLAMALVVLISWPASAQAQSLIPPEIVSPPGTSNHGTFESGAKLIAKVFDVATYAIIRYQIDRWLKEHEAEIQTRMPKPGGVLVVAHCVQEKCKGLSMPVSRFLLSIEIAETAQTREQALAKHAEPKLSAVDPAAPPRREPMFNPDLFEPFEVMEWISSGALSIPFPDPTPASEAVRRAGQLLEQIDAKVQDDEKRLDQEWKEIEKLNRAANETTDRAAPTRERRVIGRSEQEDAAEEAFATETHRRLREQIQAWKDAELRAIERQRAVIDADTRAVRAKEQELAAYTANWRCPANLTIEQCELPQNQDAARNVHLAKRQAFRAERARREREIQQFKSVLDSRANALAARSAAVPRGVEMRQRRAQSAVAKAWSDAKALRESDQQRASLRDRLRRFDEDSERLERLQTILKTGRERLAELAPKQPR
jgi:hypothetical protein